MKIMEPTTSCVFNEILETGRGHSSTGFPVEPRLIQVGHQRALSTATWAKFERQTKEILKPLFAYGVYHVRYSDEELNELNEKILSNYREKRAEEQKSGRNKSSNDIMKNHAFRRLTENDFPFHYQRASNFRKKEKRLEWKRRKEGAKSEDELLSLQKEEEKERQMALKSAKDRRKTIKPTHKTQFTHIPKTEYQEQKRWKEEKKRRERLMAGEQGEEDAQGQSDAEKERLLSYVLRSETKPENLYIYHLKFHVLISGAEWVTNLYAHLNYYTLERYRCQVAATLSGLAFMSELEDVKAIRPGDEMLIICNEATHEFEVYFKDNHVDIGFGIQPTKAVSKFDMYNKNRFRRIFGIESDLLGECFKNLFLQTQTGYCTITNGKEIPVF